MRSLYVVRKICCMHEPASWTFAEPGPIKCHFILHAEQLSAVPEHVAIIRTACRRASGLQAQLLWSSVDGAFAACRALSSACARDAAAVVSRSRRRVGSTQQPPKASACTLEQPARGVQRKRRRRAPTAVRTAHQHRRRRVRRRLCGAGDRAASGGAGEAGRAPHRRRLGGAE